MNCEDKKSYDYYLDAGVVVSFLKRQDKRRWIYLCDCGKFHLTSKLYKNKKTSRKLYKEMNIYQATCSVNDMNCNGDVITRAKDGPYICQYHYQISKGS